CARWQSGFDSW
nr:immunoglobulin heavy chain junction region [Macaca mulatta]MOV87594.1 immunoglobulin heavy chain junction region [Macaca mulatta]